MDHLLHILHIVEKNRLTTGSVVQMTEAAVGQAARGHTVTVAGRPGGDLEAVCSSVGLRFLGLALRHPFDPISVRKLRGELRSRPAHIMHVHKGKAHAVALIAAAGLGALPAVVVNRGVSFPLGLLNRWKYRHPRVGAVVCVAEAISEAMRASGVAAGRVHTIHGGTDCSRFDPAQVDGGGVRSELGVADHHSLIAQVSVRDWKGWRVLLEAVARLAPHYPDARLLFVGCESATDRVEVRRACAELALEGCVLTLPCRRDMPEVLAACDLVVDASWAGTGITGTIREAMAMQRAVVATDCGGNRELIADDEVGLLVPPRDSEELAEVMGRLLDDRALRERLGRAARRRVLGGFTTEKRIDCLEGLYRAISTEQC